MMKVSTHLVQCFCGMRVILPLHSFSVCKERERCWIKEARVMATLPLHFFSVCKEREMLD